VLSATATRPSIKELEKLTLDLGEYAAAVVQDQEDCRLLIDVLDARIGDHTVRRHSISWEVLRRLGKDLTGGLWFQARGGVSRRECACLKLVSTACKYLPRCREQLDDGQDDVPIGVWFAARECLPWVWPGRGRRPWTKPSTFASETDAGGWRRRTPCQSRGMQGERPDGHVADSHRK